MEQALKPLQPRPFQGTGQFREVDEFGVEEKQPGVDIG